MQNDPHYNPPPPRSFPPQQPHPSQRPPQSQTSMNAQPPPHTPSYPSNPHQRPPMPQNSPPAYPQRPMQGQPQYQMPSQLQPSMAGQPQHPMPGQPQRPIPGQPQRPMPGQPQLPMPGQPQRPMPGQPQRPMPGQPQRPMPGQPQRPISGQPQRPMPGQPQRPMPGQPQSPILGQPQSPMPGLPQQPLPGQPQLPLPGQPQRPMPGQLQRPMPGQPQRPMPGQPQRPMPGQPQRPMPGQPQRPMPGQPQRPMPGQPQRPMPGQPQRPMPGQPQRPMPGQPQRPMPGQPQRPMPGQPQRPMPPTQQTAMYAPPQQNGHANGYAPPQSGFPPQAEGPPSQPMQPGAQPPQPRGMYPPGYAGSQVRSMGGLRPAPAGPAPPGYATAEPQNMGNGRGAERTGESRMSSSMMPRPCALEKPAGSAREFYHRGMSLGGGGALSTTLPSSMTDVVTVDDGSARLRFMRMTTGAIGNEPSLMGKSGVPLAVVMTPFANTVVGETPVPVVNFSSKQVGGPLRCERCNAYANPGFKFMSGGSQFQCNLCLHTNQTPAEHFSPIAPATGLRMDADVRHELRLGSVDFIVGSPDYCIRTPKPACYMFAFDISSGAVASGLSAASMMSIKSAIGAGLLPGSNQGARVGIMTFDRALHFYDARGSEEGKAVTLHYVPDVDDPFVPLGGDALFLTPAQAVLAIDAAIETHGLGASQKQATDQNAMDKGVSAESAFGSALVALKMAFADCGGKAFVVAGALPSLGASKLERRGGGAIGGGEDREMGLLKEATQSYEVLGCELADVQASVDLFLAPSSVYIDASTLSRVPRACGGRMHLFTGFDPVRDGASLHRSLCAAASSARAFEALVRVRTSPGLEARGEYVGHFGRPQRGDDIAGPVLDSSSTLALEISVTSKLSEDDKNSQNRPYAGSASLFDDACVQCAILFTDCAGRRRIRVHTVFASKTSVLQDVFKHADVDAVAAFLSKKAASAVLIGGTSFSKACEALTEKTAQALFVYRKHCTTASLSGQLILPEALKVLPLMMLGLTKSAAFRKSAVSIQSGDAVTVDERAAALSFLISGTPSEVAAMCYPRMWEIQAISDVVGKPLPVSENPIVSNANGNNEKNEQTGVSKEPIAFPNTMGLSAELLTDERILLFENGMQMVVWLGSKVEKSAAEDVIVQGAGGRLLIRGETAGSVVFTKSVSERGKRVARVIERICSERRGLSRPQVVLRSAPGAGGEAKYVMPLLVEDRGNGTHSYVEYLRHVHKRVMDKMANDSAQSDMQTWEMLNHGY